MKKSRKILLILCMIMITTITNVKAYAMPYQYAEGIVLMDARTGDIIYSKNPNTQYEPASITKVMTAIVALENTSLDDRVTIGDYPPYVDGSAIGIREGEVYSMRDLLLALLLESANDCAEAIGQYISGSNAAFGELMTKRAQELGTTNTVFKNPSGLSEYGHLTTAMDMAIIMKHAISMPEFVELDRTISYILEEHPNNDGSEKWIFNRNNCYVDWSEHYYEYLYVGKTGWTPEADHTYVSAALKYDEMYIGTFLNATEKSNFYYSVGHLFDWVFDNYESKKVVSKNQLFDTVNITKDVTMDLIAAEDIYFNRNIYETEENIEVTFQNIELPKESIKKNTVVSTGTVYIDSEIYKEFDIVTATDFEYVNNGAIFIDNLNNNRRLRVIIFASIIIILDRKSVV